jgi:hypothetical protein
MGLTDTLTSISKGLLPLENFGARKSTVLRLGRTFLLQLA